MSATSYNNQINPSHFAVKQQQLLKAFETILNFFLSFYFVYSFYFEILGMLILAYLSFRLGKISLRQPIDKKANQLSALMKMRKYLRQNLPTFNLKVSKIKKITIILTVILGCAIGTAMFMEKIPKQYQNQILYSLGALLVIIFTLIYTLQWLLNRKKTQMTKNDNLINQKTTQFVELLGLKVQNSIKTTVSKQTILKNQKAKSTVCDKKFCQQQKALYKQRHQSIKHFVESVLGFEWCSNCKKRKPFDEMLSFESPVFKGEHQNQQQQVKFRVEFLSQGLGQMLNWVNTINPCNCSKLYWALSTKQIRSFKSIEKQINEALQKLTKKYSINIK